MLPPVSQDHGACKPNPNLDMAMMAGITLTLPLSSPSAPGGAAPSPLHPGGTMGSGGSSSWEAGSLMV